MSPRCVLATTSLHVYRASAARVRNASRPPECRRHRGARETATPLVSQNGKSLRTFAAIGDHAEHMLLRENSLVRIEPRICWIAARPGGLLHFSLEVGRSTSAVEWARKAHERPQWARCSRGGNSR